ncbi:MAG: chromate efflux transporter [Armatimonadota bacterium]
MLGTPVSLLQLALASLYIGITGYGGGPAIIALMHRYFIHRRGWVDEHDFQIALSLSQVLPGAQAVSVITYLGFRLGGMPGAIIAPLGLIGPATVLMIGLSALYFRFGQVPFVEALFIGLGAVVVALLAYATLNMGRVMLKDRRALPVSIAAFALLTAYNLLPRFVAHPTVAWLLAGLRDVPVVLLVVVAAAFAGLLIYRKLPLTNGDARPEGERLPPRWFWLALLAAVTLLGGALWLLRGQSLVQLALGLLRVGAFTFGGGYAAIPFFQHEALVTHDWLADRKQFLDGIALGQVTPGPVLITAAFIGYRVFGIAGALLATLAVFTPGVVAMFVLAHLHEHIRKLAWLQAMVRGVVAAFIGLLLSVTIDLALTSLTDWRTILMAAAAAVVLIVWKKDPLWVILGAALISPFIFH